MRINPLAKCYFRCDELKFDVTNVNIFVNLVRL